MVNFGSLRIVASDGTHQVVSLNRPVLSVGREAGNDIQLPDAKVSRHHARIECGPSGCTVEDLGSVNGTRVNGQPIQRALLSHNDVIKIGSYQIRFLAPSGVGGPDSEPTLLDAAEPQSADTLLDAVEPQSEPTLLDAADPQSGETMPMAPAVPASPAPAPAESGAMLPMPPATPEPGVPASAPHYERPPAMPSYAEEEPSLQPGVWVGLGLLGLVVIGVCVAGIIIFLNRGLPAAEESPVVLPERSTDAPEEPTAVREEPTTVPEVPTAIPAQPTAEPAQPTAAPPTAAPTSTREPTQTSAPDNCIDDSEFIRDVTIPDGTVLQPGVAFTKVWEIMNDGTCPWTAAYRYVYIGGDRMSAPASVPVGEVEPGESITISVNLIAPSSSGEYRANFQMENADGDLFADRPYVIIVVSP